MKFIKKYWYIILLLIILVISFCFYLGTKENKKEEETFLDKQVEEYAIDYFNRFATITNVDTYEVSIKMLKEAVNQGMTKYDLERLAKCVDNSSMKFEIEPGESNYKTYKNEFICAK